MARKPSRSTTKNDQSVLRLVLHVGLPKTGTTAIQYAMLDNGAALAKAGILYPETGLQGIAHHRLVPALIELPHDIDWIDSGDGHGLVPDLLDEVEHSEAETVVISSEALDVNAVKALVDAFRERFGSVAARVVLVLRRQDHMLEARYNQILKTGAIRRSDAALAALNPANHDWLMDYATLVDRYVEALNPDGELVVVPFEPKQLGSSLVGTFFNAADLVIDEPVVLRDRLNERLNRHALEVLRATPPDLRLIGPRYAALRDCLANYSAANRGQRSYLFSLEQRLALLDRHREGNRYAAQWCRPPQDELFFEPDPTEEAEPYQGLPPEEAAAMLLEAWNWAYDQIERLRRDNRPGTVEAKPVSHRGAPNRNRTALGERTGPAYPVRD